ncbi:MAG: hypothetical protein M1825_003835 [Sarcosagium campestre]|nr:MAG: hypothetical protein M1825_003835 [Sarcosagium campestre]
MLSSGVSTGSESALNGNGNPLSNKAHIVQTANSRHLATFEALLLGHEDWIYTLKWRSRNGHLRLLSSSADNSLAIWEPDRDTGVWVCTTRLGEISGQMGATTATGSAGGFWIGLWSPDGNSVVSLGKNGGWRLWTLDAALEQWIQRVAVSGHTKAVMDTAWTAGGEYLLSTSSDQTTRLFAEWKREGLESWREFSRPQIHGYDLNCIDTMGEHRFISGADEKLLRVFEEPRAVETLLHRLCEISAPHRDNQLETANMPVLGLSNKAVATAQTATSGTDADEVHRSQEVVISRAHQSLLDLQHPPFEDHLSRQTLWPETEKLYGHGYEISAVACSHDGHLVATACRASSIDHAVIRLFETSGWTEIKPPLSAHSLTVTALSFTQDDQFLLSVGRDRMWAVFEQGPNSTRTYKIVSSNPKGHSRMILGASWAPVESGRVFATAGRDKLVKIWKSTGSSSELEFVVKESISAASAVTALSFSPEAEENVIRLAFGTDLGVIQVCSISLNELSIISSRAIQQSLTPSRSINRLAWRPGGRRSYYNGGYVNGKKPVNRTLAATSDDNSLRIYRICILED